MIKENKDVLESKQETPKSDTKGVVLSDSTLIPVQHKNRTYYYDPVLNTITNKNAEVML